MTFFKFRIGISELFLFFAFTFLSFRALSSDAPIKWGKVTAEDFKNVRDTSGKNYRSIIICDYGEMGIDEYLHGVRNYFTRHVRIKILNKAGYDDGTVIVPFYENAEDVSKIDGQCFFQDGQGVIQKQKLEQKLIFRERTNKWLGEYRFTIPGLKEGCIIEYTYTISSSAYNSFRKWYFQSDIPILKSELHTIIPDYFTYQPLYSGELILEPKEQNSYSQIWFATQSVHGTETKYSAKNVPPIEKEPFTTDFKDYSAVINFKIIRFSGPKGYNYDYPDTWPKVAEELLDNTYFGMELKSNHSLEKKAVELTQAISDSLSKMKAIYDFVKNNMIWDKQYYYLTENLSRAFDAHSGSTADINLMLVKMLNAVNIHSFPVLISTRGNGKIVPFYTSLNQFNSVIAYTRIGGNTYLMDAIDPKRPYDVLPAEDINQTGMIIQLPEPSSVKIENSASSKTISIKNIVLNDDGTMTCSLSENYNGLIACYKRQEIKKMGAKDFFEENLQKKIPDAEIKTYSILNLDTLDAYLKLSEEYFITKRENEGKETIYFNPASGLTGEENPFKSDERILPVSFTDRVEKNYIINFTLPHNYSVSEMPTPIKLSLADNDAAFSYLIDQSGGQVRIGIKFNINNTEFGVENYSALKNFYSMVISKCAEKITLKKIN
jgi:hypothetical protein